MLIRPPVQSSHSICRSGKSPPGETNNMHLENHPKDVWAYICAHMCACVCLCLFAGPTELWHQSCTGHICMCIYLQALQNFGTSHVLDRYVRVFICRPYRTLAPVMYWTYMYLYLFAGPSELWHQSCARHICTCIYLQALQNFGTSHVLDMYLLGLSSQSDISSSEVQDFQYHAACRNANWNIKVPVR